MAKKHRKVAETSAVQPLINTKEETIKSTGDRVNSLECCNGTLSTTD